MALAPFTRDLTRDELRALVNDLATRTEVWRHEVAFSGDARHYACLHRDDHVDVWLLCWTRTNDTGWHDHDISAGAVRVVQGAINEHNPRIGGEHAQATIGDGGSFHFGPEHIHRLTAARDDTVTIHAYSPPLYRLGQYAIGEDGLLTRVSVTYADELRPIETAYA
jgi:hypothetical protein